ncbi:hypothetical protein ACFQGE_06545 [Halomicroarcula sp. GCM10025817]|uniref:DUF7535 family protein n=1 Tax=Haloarcula TaxID=2237 RepID=UPI0023E7BF6C|nr:hypothetical protein [Halomicroarcula sp. SYNS111]
MAESDESSDSILPEPLRTVTPPSRTHPDQDMDIIGWGIFLGLLVLLVPLLPFIIIVWVISKVVEALTPT